MFASFVQANSEIVQVGKLPFAVIIAVITAHFRHWKAAASSSDEIAVDFKSYGLLVVPDIA